MSEIEKNARTWLGSHSVNWELGLDLLEAMMASGGDRALAADVMRRVIEIKPALVKKFGIADPALLAIADRHTPIVLDSVVRAGAYYKVPVIGDIAALDLEVFSILSGELTLGDDDRIGADATVFGFGSCFAVNFVNYLHNHGVRARSSVLSEDINSPRNNRCLLAWVIDGEENHVSAQLHKLNPEFDPAALRENLRSASHIVLTMGTVFSLTRKNADGSPAPALVPAPGTVTTAATYDELRQDMTAIVQLVRRVNPAARIFLTVSPIPFRGIMHQANPVAANNFSKSLLRAAVESLRGEKLFTYLPIYDAVIGLSPHMDFAAFGKDDGESRHLNGAIIDAIMRQITSLIVKAPTGKA